MPVAVIVTAADCPPCQHFKSSGGYNRAINYFRSRGYQVQTYEAPSFRQGLRGVAPASVVNAVNAYPFIMVYSDADWNRQDLRRGQEYSPSQF